MSIETLISQRLSLNLLKDISVYKFIEELSSCGELIFFGGSIRDLYLENKSFNNPRDYDIVINTYDENINLEKYFESFKYKKNRFGGYKIEVNSTEFDVWKLDNTWAFNNNLVEKNESNLINSVYLSVDGIAYNYNKKKLYDSVLKKTNDQKEISIVLDRNPQKELNLLRGLVYKKKYNYGFSYTLKSEYRFNLAKNKNFAKLLHDLQFEHYKEEKLSYKQIVDELNEV